MGNRPAFGVDEWYHCYNRGVDRRRTFESQTDYRRFVQLLYLCNSKTKIHRSDLFTHSHQEILSKERGEPLVAIAAYTLMSNHFHLLIREIEEDGISAFMQKIGIAYTMYFNIKHERNGNLFVKPFRSRHIDNDEYLKYVAQYIHLNPAELFEPEWKNGRVKNISSLRKYLESYQWSSLPDYYGEIRLERGVLDHKTLETIGNDLPPLGEILGEASAYYRELPM